MPDRPASDQANAVATASEYSRAAARLNRGADSSAPAATWAEDSAWNRPCDAIGSNAEAASPTAIQLSPAASDSRPAEASTRSRAPDAGAVPDRLIRQV